MKNYLDAVISEWVDKMCASCPSAKSSIHGASHWRQVEKNGIMLAEHTSGNIRVVRFFSVFHDACRINDDNDVAHGHRAANLVSQVGELIPLNKEELRLLRIACAWHNDGKTSKDPTIGTCWDADRLDLLRCGLTLDPDLFSTEYARGIVLKQSEQV